jgi:hypothetical protein
MNQHAYFDHLVHVVVAIGDAAAVVVLVAVAIVVVVVVWLKILNFRCVHLEIDRER